MDQLTRYHKHRAILLEELGGKCTVCASTDKLQFDHINKKEKQFDLGKSFNLSLDRLRIEAQKCQLLCFSCHIEKTKTQKDWLSKTNVPRPEEWKHGTFNTRYKRKCKCDLCSEYASKRNQNRRV